MSSPWPSNWVILLWLGPGIRGREDLELKEDRSLNLTEDQVWHIVIIHQCHASYTQPPSDDYRIDATSTPS